MSSEARPIDRGLTFSLDFFAVPRPPDSDLWADNLRWMVMVMDCDDPYLSFVAGCLSQALKMEGLTRKQATACERIKARVVAAWQKSALDCQSNFDR